MSFDHDSNLMHAKISWTCTASMCFNSQLIRKHIFAHSQQISYIYCVYWAQKLLMIDDVRLFKYTLLWSLSSYHVYQPKNVEIVVKLSTLLMSRLFIIFYSKIFFLSFIVVSFRLFVCFDFVVIIVDMVHRQARTVDGTICIYCVHCTIHTRTRT